VNPEVTEVVIGIVTFVLSVGASMFIAGARWGTMEAGMRTMNERMARIEGMFTLRLKDPSDS
jgi:hypothetical protein